MNVNADNFHPSESEDELDKVIGALALKIHLTGSKELSCEMPAQVRWPSSKRKTTDYEIAENTVRFSSLEARNRTVATHALRENAPGGGAAEWLIVAYGLWRHEIGSKDSAAGRLLALIHETSDVFVMTATSINNKSIRVFDALLTLQSAFPYLRDLPPNGIWEVCNAQYELTKNDIAAGMFFGKLGDVLIQHPNVCRAIHERLTKEITESTANLHPTAIVSLARSSPEEAVRLTLQDAEHSNTTLKTIALWTLAQLIILSFVDDDSMREAQLAIIASMSSPIDTVRSTSIRAAAIASQVTDAFVEELHHLGEAQDLGALGAIAEALWRNQREMKDKAFFHGWVRFLCRTPPSSSGILEQFDHTLCQLLSEKSEQQFALSCLTEWVDINGVDSPRNESVPKIFNTVTLELTRQRELLSQLITEWLLSDGRRLPSAAAGLLSYLGVHGLGNPEFCVARLDTLEEPDLLYLARRLVGFVFSEDHLLSLAMSFFKIKDAPVRAFPVLWSLLVDEIGYDYPYSTLDALESAKSASTEPEWNAFYTSTIEAIKGRMNELTALPRLMELEPPNEIQRQLRRARAEQMNKAMDGARQESVIRRILTEVPIKAGTGYFSFQDGGYTEPAQLKTLSHSINLPRRVILDTVGYELSLWTLREAERGES